MLNTLGNNRFVHKGSQWALHNASDVYGPLQALVNVKVLYKGVLDKPMCTHWVEFNDDIS